MGIRLKKKRKSRGVKLNGHKSLDMCPCCLSFHCNPMFISLKLKAKFNKRMENGKCPACGNNPCKCKSQL